MSAVNALVNPNKKPLLQQHIEKKIIDTTMSRLLHIYCHRKQSYLLINVKKPQAVPLG